MSDDRQKMSLGYQDAFFASANPYLSTSCKGVFVTSGINRSFAADRTQAENPQVSQNIILGPRNTNSV